MKGIAIVVCAMLGFYLISASLTTYKHVGGAVERGESLTLTRPERVTSTTTVTRPIPEMGMLWWKTPASTETLTSETTTVSIVPDRPGQAEIASLSNAILMLVIGGFALLALIRMLPQAVEVAAADAAAAKAKTQEQYAAVKTKLRRKPSDPDPAGKALLQNDELPKEVPAKVVPNNSKVTQE